MPTSTDTTLRAITDDDDFRVISAITTQTVRQILAKQQPPDGETSSQFVDLLTGTVLVRETMSPYHRVQAVLRGAGGHGRLVVDTHPDGTARGLVQLTPDHPTFLLGVDSQLEVMRTVAKGLQRGVVQVPDGGGISDGIMAYLVESEQTAAVVATAHRWEGDELASAGGYVVQLLPGTEKSSLARMTTRLEALPTPTEMLQRADGKAQALLEQLLTGIPFSQLEERPVSFHCPCSIEAVVAGIASLGRDEIAEIVAEQEVVEVTCDYCCAEYQIGRSQLTGLLATS